MTHLDKRKTRIRAVTSARVRGRALVVELHPDGYGLTLREQGRRIGFPVTWSSVYTLAATQAAEQLRAQRRAARRRP